MLGTLSLALFYIAIVIFSYYKFKKSNSDIFLGLYFGALWALLNVFVREGFYIQLKSSTMILIYCFIYTSLFVLVVEGYNKGLMKLTGMDNYKSDSE